MDIVRQLLFEAKKKEWIDGLQWLCWSAVLGLMPIWMTMLLFRLFKQSITLHSITSNGEFALYAASFLGTCFYIVARDFRERSFPSRGSVLIMLTVFLVGSVVIYAVASLVTFMGNLATIPIMQHFDREFLLVLNLWILPVVCLITYFLIVADNVRATADLTAVSKRKFDAFEAEFDKL